jgi:hypothetical protein
MHLGVFRWIYSVFVVFALNKRFLVFNLGTCSQKKNWPRDIRQICGVWGHPCPMDTFLVVFMLISKKTFDKIDHSKLFDSLQKICIHGNFLRVLKWMYSDLKSCVKTQNCFTDFFRWNIGTRQGDKSSSTIFIPPGVCPSVCLSICTNSEVLVWLGEQWITVNSLWSYSLLFTCVSFLSLVWLKMAKKIKGKVT